MKQKKLILTRIVPNYDESAFFLYFKNDLISRVDFPSIEKISINEIVENLLSGEDGDKIKIIKLRK